MRETQRNIRNYQKKLVGVKEKLATAGLLFLMSAVMLTTATFAWITLSLNPEVSGIETTIAGNGNLEIALAYTSDDGNLYAPLESQVGDSNKALNIKNTTWGNLVNLSDPSYGMERIVLKPATLYKTNLIDHPLISVKYSHDGRIVGEESEDKFQYTNFNSELNSGVGGFEASSIMNYGVRAISSVHESSDNTFVVQAAAQMKDSKRALGEEYLAFVDKHQLILCDIIGIFVSDKARATSLGDGVKADYRPNIPDIVAFMQDFLYMIEKAYVFYDELAHLQYVGDPEAFPYETIGEMIALGEKGLANKGIPGTAGLDRLITMHKNISKYITSLNDKNADTTTYPVLNWEHIATEVNYIVVVSDCVINDEYRVGDISGSTAISMLPAIKNGNNRGEIKKGAIVDFEKTIGAKIDLNVTIKSYFKTLNSLALSVAGIKLDKDGYFHIEANVYTSAIAPYDIDKAITSAISEMNKGQPIVYEADDIYGMAIDFWVRTNVPNSYLTLEGKADVQYSVMTTSEGCATYIDENETVFYHRPASGCNVNNFVNTNPENAIDENSLMTGDIYYYSSNQKLVFDTPTEQEKAEGEAEGITFYLREDFLKTLKYNAKTHVVGYDGVNRVWQTDTEMIDPGSSTTQGKGSCFIFYPSDPVEQKKMLELLGSFSVAFVSQQGELLARAKLNSDLAYEEGGKITVPLELISGTTVTDNSDMSTSLSITELPLNESTLITAIVYIEGTELENLDVNAATSINGALNLQFGSSELLNSMRDDELEMQTIHISSGIKKSGTSDEYGTTIDYGENPSFPVSADIMFTVSGLDAGEVYANFVRSVNNFQGVTMEKINFRKSADGEWKGTYEFNVPGTYVINRVWIDGIEYKLNESLTADVGEFSVGAISWDQSANEVYYMSSDNHYTISLGADISASSQYTPNTAKALFRNEANEYLTINLKPSSSGMWMGTGTFTTSGRYVLEYVVIDNDMYCYVPENQQKIINLYLGLYANISLDRTRFDWSAEDTTGESNVVTITNLKLYDNKDNPLEKMNDVTLRYHLSGSDNYLEAQLEWNAEQQYYTGKFNVLYPGVYSFETLKIGSTNRITKAKANDIMAIPPYEPTYIRNSLVSQQYVFAPNNDASYDIQISDSSTAKIVAEVLYTNPQTNKSDTYYIPATVKSTDSSTRITEWSVVPVLNNETKLQDGIWEFKKLYLTDVYYEGGWQSASGEEWWSSNSGVIVWDAEVFTDNREYLKMDVLNDVYVNVTANYAKPSGLYSENTSSKSVTYTSDFTNSLNNEFYISGFGISYKDSFGRVMDSEKYNVAITDSMTYSYTANSSTNEVGTTGWLTAVDGDNKYLSEWTMNISDQVVEFDGNDGNVYLTYPGIYSPNVNIKATTNGKTYTNTSGSSNYSDCINITNSLSYAVVTWNRPDVKFTAVDPAAGTSFLTNDLSNSQSNKSNSVSERAITVYMKYTAKTTCASESYDASTATAQLSNYGAATTATATAYNGTTKKFEFTFSNSNSATATIGSANGSNREPIGSATITEVVITYNGAKYTFKLPVALTATGEH